MDDPKYNALKEMLDRYELKQQQQIQQRDDRRIELEKFLSAYLALTESVIKPGFAEFSATLAKRGHPCTVEMENPGNLRDILPATKITLTIFPDAATLTHGNPSLSYTASSNQRKIAAHRCTLTSSGGVNASSVGEYSLEQLSRDVIEQHLFDLAASVFNQ
jgi:hypothetical protein